MSRANRYRTDQPKILHLFPATTAANLGELERNLEASNTARMSLRTTTLNIPLLELGLTRPVNTAAQFTEVLLNSVRVEAQIITEIGGVGSELVGRITTQRAGSTVLGGLGRNVQ
jgi:hypothetical protein